MIAKIARSPIARIIAALVGVSIIALSIRHAGTDAVQRALHRAALYAPIAALLEAGIVACDMIGLRRLYGADRKRIPRSSFVWAGLIGYPVQILVPMGRAVAEAARAAVFARHVGAAHAAVSAARLQAVLLLANGGICIPCAGAALLLGSSKVLPLAILGNGLVMLTLGAVMLYAGTRSRIGEWLARLTSRLEGFGASFDERLRGEPIFPKGALLATFSARVVQVIQCGVLVAAVGGHLGLLEAFSAEGVNLVGATIGDLVPAQLGATEATFTWTAGNLALDASDALSIALLVHLGQMFWAAVGLIAPLVWGRDRGTVVNEALDAGRRPK
jgi:uncharacterized membrane protein YbhN (UPF0104 family)